MGELEALVCLRGTQLVGGLPDSAGLFSMRPIWLSQGCRPFSTKLVYANAPSGDLQHPRPGGCMVGGIWRLIRLQSNRLASCSRSQALSVSASHLHIISDVPAISWAFQPASAKLCDVRECSAAEGPGKTAGVLNNATTDSGCFSPAPLF